MKFAPQVVHVISGSMPQFWLEFASTEARQGRIGCDPELRGLWPVRLAQKGDTGTRHNSDNMLSLDNCPGAVHC